MTDAFKILVYLRWKCESVINRGCAVGGLAKWGRKIDSSFTKSNAFYRTGERGSRATGSDQRPSLTRCRIINQLWSSTNGTPNVYGSVPGSRMPAGLLPWVGTQPSITYPTYLWVTRSVPVMLGLQNTRWFGAHNILLKCYHKDRYIDDAHTEPCYSIMAA